VRAGRALGEGAIPQPDRVMKRELPPDIPQDRWGERLPRELGLVSAIGVLVGSTIGAGIFRAPGVIAERVDQVWLFVAAWIAGGVLSLAGALTYAELAAMFPRSGGIYVFIRESVGRAPAFLLGWAQILIIKPAAWGALAITSAEFACRLLGIDPASGAGPVPLSIAQIVGVSLILIVSGINIVGVQLGALINNLSNGLKVGALLLLVVLAFALGHDADSAATTGSVAREPPAWSTLPGFGLAMVTVLWTYDGWADLTSIAGEVREPQRILPRALLLGTMLVIVVYLLVNVTYLRTVSLERMRGAPLVAADAAQLVLGSAGGLFIAAAAMISAFGTLNAGIMTGPRIFFAMAEDRLFFRWIAWVHPRFRTPAISVALGGGLAALAVSIRSFGQLVDQFVIGIWPFYALAAAGVFVLRRRRPEIERPYRIWGYPFVPGLFLAAAALLLGNYLVAQPLAFAINVGVILLGLPSFFYLERNVRLAERSRVT